jgi:inner membrane protein
MDNLTHSLIGAAFAHAARPPAATAAQHRLLVAAGVLSANLPDVDLVYVGITPEPLGYLLHHRGHTHTLVGLAVQAAALAAGGWLVPPLRHLAAALRGRLAGVIAAGLLSHLLLDAGNSYGVHPFHPFDARWYFGDAVFILEPWLWLLLGIPVAWGTRRQATRALVFGVVLLLPLAMAGLGVLTPAPAAVLAAGAALYGAWTRRLPLVPRAAAAPIATALFFAASFALSRHAGRAARAELAPRLRGELVDVVLNPNPADPVCWMVIGVERNEAEGAYVLHPGTMSLAPARRPPSACASHRFTAGPGATATARASWSRPQPQPLGRLRALAAEDCWTRAWLQFGRAPFFDDDVLADLRFAQGARDNFTAMRVPGPAGNCPPHVTSWALPRADLLAPPR